MTKTNWFLLSLVAVLLVTTFCFYRKTDYLERRIECLGDNVIYACDSICASQFERYEFREQSYIRQQEHDSNLILAVFAIAVTFLTIATWKIGQTEIEALKVAISENNKTQYDNHKKYQTFLEETRAQLNFETYITRTQDALRYWDDNKPISIMLWIASNTYLTGFYIFKLKYSPDKADEELKKMRAGLSKLLDKIGNTEIIMTGVNQVTIDGSIGAIMQCKDEQVINLLNQIRLKLRFTS